MWLTNYKSWYKYSYLTLKNNKTKLCLQKSWINSFADIFYNTYDKNNYITTTNISYCFEVVGLV